MPIYEYLCEKNGRIVEVIHGHDARPETWGELCALTGEDCGHTPSESPVLRKVSSPSLSFPKTNSELKNLGFTKLVKRDTGVYENVTATDKEKKYMRSDDPGSLPDLKSKITD
jgi:hypothetical protein